MDTNSAVLVSGATGFLGSALIEELVTTTTAQVYALVRPRDNRTAAQRLESLWCERPVLREALGERVMPVEGDIEQERLGMEQQRYDELAQAVNVVVHTAAEVGVNQTKQRFWDVNVRGTSHMLEFAQRAGERGGLDRFVHISSAYVAGRREGSIGEELFAEGPFNSLYEWSKHEAELLVSSYAPRGFLPCRFALFCSGVLASTAADSSSSARLPWGSNCSNRSAASASRFTTRSA